LLLQKERRQEMTEDITVKVIRHNPKDPSLYITGDIADALRVFDERVAAHSQTGRLAVSKVELWVGDRLIKYADKDGVFDVKYTKVGVYQGVEEDAE
jgi:hypothetical protein